MEVIDMRTAEGRERYLSLLKRYGLFQIDPRYVKIIGATELDYKFPTSEVTEPHS